MYRKPWERRDPGYIPIDRSGNDYAGMVGAADPDRTAIEAAQNRWYDARDRGDKAGQEAAHREAEAIRSKYNYSGGSDGSQYLPWGGGYGQGGYGGAGGYGGGFSYKEAPQYVNRYQNQINALMGQIMNRPAFSYNPETDPSYAAYSKQYAREGQRATENTLAQAAAMTGGMPSTAAMTAASQAGDYYASKMADKIPELQQIAYQMYMDQGIEQRRNMDLLQQLEAGDYGKFRDTLGQYNTDRGFAYGSYRDTIDDRRYADEMAYNRQQAEKDRQYDFDLQRAKLLASAGDYSGFKALGYSDSDIKMLNAAYAKQQAKPSRGSGRDGGGGRGSSSSKPRLTASQTLKALQDGLVNESTLAAYEYWYGQPWGGGDDQSGKGGDASSVDMGSILALGYGPIDEDALAAKIKSGEVIEYVEEGKLKYRRNPGGGFGFNAGMNAFNRR